MLTAQYSNLLCVYNYKHYATSFFLHLFVSEVANLKTNKYNSFNNFQNGQAGRKTLIYIYKLVIRQKGKNCYITFSKTLNTLKFNARKLQLGLGAKIYLYTNTNIFNLTLIQEI